MSLWNTTFTGGTDWSSVSFVQMFWQALIERQQALGQTPAYLPAVGADVQYGGSAAPASTTGKFSWAYLQNWILSNLGSFANPSLAGTGSSGTSWAWTQAALYAAAGLNASGFTRQYPREFATLTSTTYTDGSAFANGQSARCVANGIVYTRTSGVWAAATAGTGPDTVTAYGVMAPGDYIGPWIWTQLVQMFNRLTERTVAVGYASAQQWYGSSGSGKASRGLAYASAAGAYASIASEGDYATEQVYAYGQPPNCECTINSMRYQNTLSVPVTPCSAQAALYLYIGVPSYGATYNSESTTYPQATWFIEETDSLASGATGCESGWIGSANISTPPANYDPSTTDSGTAYGWMVTGSVWVVTYAFQYTSST